MTTTVRSRMTHRALIERDARDDTDRYDKPDWQPLYADQPCFFYNRSAGREAVAPYRTVAIDQLLMMLPPDVVVTSKDRVNGVKDRAGVTLYAGRLNIITVNAKGVPVDHVELTLERAS